MDIDTQGAVIPSSAFIVEENALPFAQWADNMTQVIWGLPRSFNNFLNALEETKPDAIILPSG